MQQQYQHICKVFWRWLAGAALAATLFTPLIFLHGCKPTLPPDGPPKPFHGVIVRVATPSAPALKELLERHRENWEELSGGSVEIVSADSAAVDVRILSAAEMPHGAQAGKLMPIPAPALDSSSFESG